MSKSMTKTVNNTNDVVISNVATVNETEVSNAFLEVTNEVTQDAPTVTTEVTEVNTTDLLQTQLTELQTQLHDLNSDYEYFINKKSPNQTIITDLLNQIYSTSSKIANINLELNFKTEFSKFITNFCKENLVTNLNRKITFNITNLQLTELDVTSKSNKKQTTDGETKERGDVKTTYINVITNSNQSIRYNKYREFFKSYINFTDDEIKLSHIDFCKCLTDKLKTDKFSPKITHPNLWNNNVTKKQIDNIIFHNELFNDIKEIQYYENDKLVKTDYRKQVINSSEIPL